MSTGAPPKVLIVNDVESNCRLLLDVVVMEHCEALVASGGAEALAILDKETVDLVLLDMTDPDRLAMLAELQEHQWRRDLPVVIVAAIDDSKGRLDSLAAGATDVLNKPIDRVELSCKIRSLVELKRLREAARQSPEHAWRESDHRLRLRFQQSSIAEIQWTQDGRVANWNPAAERLFGYLRAEAVGQHVSFILPEEARADAAAFWQEAGNRQSTHHNLTKEGRTLLCEWHSGPLVRDNTPLGVWSMVFDVTERERLLDARIHARKMISIAQLAGGIAHDFNNILAVILSYAEFIGDALAEGDPIRDDVNEVRMAADRAAGLTRQLLTFSQQQPTNKRPLNLNDNLAQMPDLLSRSLGSLIDVTIEAPVNEAVVLIDPVQFDQVVLNLAINAREAMPDGGQLCITLERAVDRVVLSVKDTGTGMDASTRARIFEPFFTTKKKGMGNGLGLATTFGIVEDAGGSIRVESKLGQGTTFFVELPLCPGVAETADSAQTRPLAGRGETVLVVEDEPGLRRIAFRVLKRAGYKVLLASDGDEAVQCIDKLGPELDIIISDIIMPKRGGFEVAAHAALHIPGTPVLLMSGYVEQIPGRNHPGGPILWKPVAPAELTRAISQALANSPQSRSEPPTEAVKLVLLVDDDKTIIAALSRLLTRSGYKTVTASSVAQAKELVKRGGEPWLVLCDLSLPDGSGGEFLGWLRELQPGLSSRLYLLTGGARTEADRKLVESGEFEVLNKPIAPKLLVQLLDRVRAESLPMVS